MYIRFLWKEDSLESIKKTKGMQKQETHTEGEEGSVRLTSSSG
jgi:hypothetical protein